MLAAWNIRCGRNAGLTSAAKGLAQMGVGIAVVTETKITDDRYTRLASGYKILASKAASHNQGGIALLWKENHQGFEVESAKILTPNLLTFQFVTGDERFYCMGIYLPPADTMGVEDLRAAWEACPEGCMPLVLGDLNVNFSEPRDERDEVIRDYSMTSTLSTRRDDKHLGDHADNQPGHGGLGGRRGKGSCTTRSQIISWRAIGTAGDFGTWGFDGRDITTRTTEPSSRP